MEGAKLVNVHDLHFSGFFVWQCLCSWNLMPHRAWISAPHSQMNHLQLQRRHMQLQPSRHSTPPNSRSDLLDGTMMLFFIYSYATYSDILDGTAKLFFLYSYATYSDPLNRTPFVIMSTFQMFTRMPYLIFRNFIYFMQYIWTIVLSSSSCIISILLSFIL